MRNLLRAFLADEVLPHTRAEERTFYPAARRDPDASLLVRALISEHRDLAPDRNPLRRTADRVEAAVMAALLVVFLAVVPLAALAGAGSAAAAVADTGFLVRRILDRRRLAAWDTEWSRTGPQWTGRQ